MPNYKFPMIITTALMIGACSHKDHAHEHHDHEQEHHGSSHNHHAHDHHETSEAGELGVGDEVSREIIIEANDDMRFVHQPLNIKVDETVKFIVTNKGAVRHEFSVGTQSEHQKHSEMMLKNPEMDHGDEGPSITLEPGETKSLVWKFKHAHNVQIACNLPGHYQAGMFSSIELKH